MRVRFASHSAAEALKVIAAECPNNPAAVMTVNQRTKEKQRKSVTFVDLSIHLYFI